MNPRLLPAALALALASAPAALAGQHAEAPPLDRDLLLADLSALAHDSMRGRAPGTPGSEHARALLVSGLERAGAQPVDGSYEHPFTWGAGTRSEGVNVLARVDGSEHPDRYIVLGAHYDHLGTRDGVVYNGADDNASGAAALLAVARALTARPLRHTVILAAFDAEESGLRGSRAFVADPPVPLERVALMVNMDMIARTGGVLWAGGAHHTPALRPILEDVVGDAPLTLRLGHDRPGAPEGDDWTNASDHAPFHAQGIPFVYFGVEDHTDYHRPTDDVERIAPDEYVAAVRTVLIALRALDSALPLPRAP